MSDLLLDTGALIAVDRGDHRVTATLKAARARGVAFRTTGIVVAQAWRNGSRQARLAQLLGAVEVRPVDQEMGRAAGALLGSSGTEDAADATLIVAARDGDTIVTSDPRDIAHLVQTARKRVTILRC